MRTKKYDWWRNINRGMYSMGSPKRLDLWEDEEIEKNLEYGYLTFPRAKDEDNKDKNETP